MDKEGLTLRELEERSGVHFSHLSRVFNGKCRIGFDALIRIAAAFEMSPIDFYPYDDNHRMTPGQKFDEITRCLDLKSQNFILEQVIKFVKEYNRLKFEFGSK
jgi:transcriptional regulator with XRE-family HTH domain